MKPKFHHYFLILLLFTSFTTNAQQIAHIESKKIQSENLSQERELLIYTPAGYDESQYSLYNVIYVFDAQNREIFDFVHSSLNFMKSLENERYIVVGITSPYIDSIDYARNNDYLPLLKHEADQKRYGKYSGNAIPFSQYFLQEVMTYIDDNYKVGNNNVVVGHSLSASFILSNILPSEKVFKGYIAVSPNFAYEDKLTAKRFINHIEKEINEDTFVFVCHANEGNGYWEHWVKPREEVYAFIEKYPNEHMEIEVKAYPNENHYTVLRKGLWDGLESFMKYYNQHKFTYRSKEKYQLTVNCIIKDTQDKTYITGGQKALGDWNPKKVKMDVINDSLRSITLEVTSPVEFKITRGSWESEAIIKNHGNGNIKIDPSKQKEVILKVEDWLDQ